ncbi:ABC transporter permease [Croceitalea sp. MTPC5]|uniref:ABC transporter permease n=1 Tax=Croceitalea sp. MTPC5 TaxID=3056565 RepID=UPI002B3FBE1B|nr:ABC transporter permease [Croceitalea sp. MTPC5]
MLKHNLKLFFRNIKRSKGTFLINTIGLGVGIASFLVLSIYLYNDLTYNHFNENLANIYRIQEVYEDGTSTATKGLLLPQMQQEIPEIVNGTRIFDWDGYRLSHGDNAFMENVFYVDHGFFSVFSFPFKEGNAQNVLDEKYTAVISKAFAKKYFGATSALGKQLQIGFDNTFLTVNGVVDIPENSSVKFDIVTSYESGETISPWIKEVHDWYNTFSETYVLLQEGTSPSVVENKLKSIVKANFLPVGENTTKIGLLPFSEYHAAEESNQTLIIILAIIALGVIGIAIVNFINLTVVNALSRTREIGVKKVHGASKKQVVQQIMIESFAIGFIALLLGIFILSTFILPAFNVLFETHLILQSFNPYFLGLLLFGIWGFVGVCSSIVPSLLWSRSKLVENLQGKYTSKSKLGLSKYSSVIIQFVIAIILISGTILVRKQIDFMLDKNPKFDSENVIVAQTDFWKHSDLDIASGKLDVIAKELAKSPYVASVNFTGSIPGDYDENYNTFYPMGESAVADISLRKSYVGKDYFKTLGIDVLSGHGFNKEPTALKNTVVLNQTAMDQLGYTEADGQILVEGREGGTQYRVVGVIDDFSYQGVQSAIQPLAHFFVEQENLMNWDYLTVRSEKLATLQVIDLIKEKWQELFPGQTLDYFFADEKLNVYYDEYRRVNTLITWFSILAVVLSCMGLFALASYTMARRTKEIGIRKVNGATITQILSLLNKDFVKWVALAFAIATPISWYAMNKWLEGFAYKTNIDWQGFVFAGLIVMAITLLTVSWQSVKAAVANPVESLRDE